MLLFKPSEIVNFAIEIEKNGEKFYSSLNDKITNEGVKGVFQFLAAEEFKHIADFQSVKSNLDQYQAPEQYQGEYLDYLRTLVDTHVFKQDADMDSLINQISSDLDAINLAIQFEKESIFFYSGLLRLVATEDRKPVEELIHQEHEHIRRLLKIKETL